uniref:Uncharacterized protein n=1 Tax=Acrobeloides nanus TaxID=290746 RepID=A0A914DPI4_9BILA
MANIQLVKIDKLKEQMSAGLPKSKPALEEQLIQLQGIIGKYTLSPQCYEQGLDSLKEVAGDNVQYATLIDKIRSSFRAELKTQPELLTECLQGDVCFAFKGSPKKLTLATLNEILNYYKPLMKPKAYTKQQHWLQQRYDAQSLLLPPQVKQQRADLSSVKTQLAINNQNHSICQGSIANGKPHRVSFDIFNLNRIRADRHGLEL